MAQNSKLSVIEVILLIATFIIIAFVGFAMHQATDDVTTGNNTIAHTIAYSMENVYG